MHWSVQICQALQHAHENGVIHRDLKLSNLILTAKDERLMVIDFGIARAIDISGEQLTRTGQLLGTPMYMAPEQITNPSATDHRADLYSLGVIMYRLLSGKSPYEFKNMAELVQQKLVLDPSSITSVLPEIDPDLAQLVDRLQRPDPANRPGSATEVLELLRDILVAM